MKRPFQPDASFWLTMVAYAIAGTCMFLTTSLAKPMFTNLNDDFSFPIHAVMYVGPAGRLVVAFLGPLLALWIQSTRWRLVSAILILLLSVAVICTAMFTNIERPTHISASNERPGVDAGGRPVSVSTPSTPRHSGRTMTPDTT